MKKRVKKIQLSRTAAHTKAILRNLFRSLIEKEQIVTTTKKAKALKVYADRIMSRCQNNPEYLKNKALMKFTTADMVPKIKKLLDTKYKNRIGGYTKIIKIENERNDCASSSMVKLV